jgi:deoxyribonuclease-1
MLTVYLLLLNLASADVKSDLYLSLKSAHQPISYKEANEILFTKLNETAGVICSVYSPSFCLTSFVIPDHKVMNIEHTWPQSQGALGEAKSDLHHLFPASSSINSIRGSLPFCDVQTVKWEDQQSKRGYNEFNEHCFEPPNEHKGNVARALFYFATRYNRAIDDREEQFLRAWHFSDPVDAKEMWRNDEIQKFQNIRNPFIDDSELVQIITNF